MASTFDQEEAVKKKKSRTANPPVLMASLTGLGITHQASLWSHCRWRLWRFQQYTMLRTMKIIQGCTLYQRFQLHRTSVSAKNSMVLVTLHRNFGFFFFHLHPSPDRVSLCSLGCDGTCSIEQAGLKFRSMYLPLPCSRGSPYLRVLELSYIQEYKWQYRKLRHN